MLYFGLQAAIVHMALSSPASVSLNSALRWIAASFTESYLKARNIRINRSIGHGHTRHINTSP